MKPCCRMLASPALSYKYPCRLSAPRISFHAHPPHCSFVHTENCDYFCDRLHSQVPNLKAFRCRKWIWQCSLWTFYSLIWYVVHKNQVYTICSHVCVHIVLFIIGELPFSTLPQLDVFCMAFSVISDLWSLYTSVCYYWHWKTWQNILTLFNLLESKLSLHPFNFWLVFKKCFVLTPCLDYVSVLQFCIMQIRITSF